MIKNKKIIGYCLLGFIIILLITIGYIGERKENVTNEGIILESNEENIKEIKVYIIGEVKKPGVYPLEEGDRVEDIIKMAGGFTQEADISSINLAQLVIDQMKIVVNKIGDVTSQKGVTDSGKVKINSASKDELMSVPGIGDVTASKILEYREKNGGFKNIEELKNIDRIGDKTFENIKGYFILW